MFFRNALPVLAVLILATGCATNKPTKFQTTDASGTQGGVSIGFRAPRERGDGFYALIEPQGADVWRIVSFGPKPISRQNETQEVLFASSDASWVQPAFDFNTSNSTLSFNCFAFEGTASKAQGRDVNGSSYSPCRSTRFSTVDVGTTVLRNGLWVPFTLGTAAGTNRSVDSKAVFSAMTAVGLIEKVKAASASLRSAKQAVSDLNRADDDLASRLQRKLVFDEQITDRTGLYQSDNKFWTGVKFEKPMAVGPYRSAVEALATTYASAEEYVAAHEAEATRIREAIKGLPDKFAMSTKCPQTASGRYALTVKCPDQIRWVDVDAGQKTPLLVEIRGYTPGLLHPEFVLADKIIEIKAAGSDVQLTNRTTDYLEVREVTCYVDSEISTRKWTAGEYLTLPPQSELRPPLRRDDVCREATQRGLRLSSLRLSDVAGKSLKFGIAVKYRRVGESTDRTLYQQKSYPLDRLVKDTL